MNNSYTGIKKNLDSGICVSSIRQAQKTGNSCDLKTCVQCQRNERKSKAVKLSESKSDASTGTNRSKNNNVMPIDLFIKWLTPEKKYVLKTLKGIKDREPETFEKMKLMSLTELSNFIFDSDNQEEQRSFNEFAIKYQKGAGVKLSQLSNREIQETINQMRNIRREINSMTEIVVPPLTPKRKAEIRLTEEFKSLQSGFCSIESELAPKNSLMPEPIAPDFKKLEEGRQPGASDFYKIEGIRKIQTDNLSNSSRKKQELQNKNRDAKYEHAKFLETPEAQKIQWEQRHGKESQSSYDYLFGK